MMENTTRVKVQCQTCGIWYYEDTGHIRCIVADAALGALVRKMPEWSLLHHNFDGTWQYIDTAIELGEGEITNTPEDALRAALKEQNQ